MTSAAEKPGKLSKCRKIRGKVALLAKVFVEKPFRKALL